MNASRIPSAAARHAVESGTAPVALSRLWLGILVAPSVWVIAELAGYYLAARSCEPVVGGVPLRGTSAPAVVHIALQIAAAIAAAIGLWIAVGSWRESSRLSPEEAPPAVGRAHFMAFAGLFVSCVFMFGIVLFGFAGTVVRACSQAR